MNKALNDSLIWHKKMLAEKTLKSLGRNNIGGCYVETLKDARDELVGLIPKPSCEIRKLKIFQYRTFMP